MKLLRIACYFIVLILTLCFCPQGFTAIAYAEENMVFAQNDNYLFDTILVTLKTDANKRTKTYTCADFSNIDCISVEDLTTKTNDKIDMLVKKAIEGETLTSEEIKFVKGTSSFKRILKLKLSTNTKESLIKTIRQLRKRGDILYADPDYNIEYMSIQPDDPGYINNPTDGYQWYIDEINLPQAWDITTGSYSTKVCIIDTKIKAGHEEFVNWEEDGFVINSNISVAGHKECIVTYGGGGVQSYIFAKML